MEKNRKAVGPEGGAQGEPARGRKSAAQTDGDRRGISVWEFVRLLWEGFSVRKAGAGGGQRTGQLSDGLGSGEDQAKPGAGEPADDSSRLLDYGRKRGWLEAQDISGAEKVLVRSRAAAILHEFLKRECGEADEADWGTATELADLYDCRVCVNHVAQMYAKGIMEGKTLDGPGHCEGGADAPSGNADKEILYFGMRDPVTHSEAELIIARALDEGRRAALRQSRSAAMETGERKTGRQAEESAKEVQAGHGTAASPGEANAERRAVESFEKTNAEHKVAERSKTKETGRKVSGIPVTPGKAEELRREYPGMRFWDVRTRAEYEREHPEGAENVPFTEILEAPEKWSGKAADGVILYCDGGYRSRMTADALAQAGCGRAYYLRG